MKHVPMSLANENSEGATSIDKIGEVWLSDEIGDGGFEICNYY